MKKLLMCLLCVNFVTFISYPSSSETVSASTGNLPGKEVPTEEYPALNEIEEPNIITLEPEGQDNDDEELVDTSLPPLGESKEEEETVTESKAEAEIEKSEIEKPETEEPEIEKPEIEKSETEEKTAEEKTDVVTEGESETKSETGTESESEVKPAEENKKETEIKTEGEKPAEEEQQTAVTTVTEETIEPVVDVISPSRSVTVKRREYIDITYPGTGWIYTGIVDGSKDLSYFGRALGTKDTTFTLQAVVPGTKLLHFCKNDYLTGEYLDDYIEVVILNEEGSNKTHIEAPEYKQPEPEVFKTFAKSSENTSESTSIEKTETVENKETEKSQENASFNNAIENIPETNENKTYDKTSGETPEISESLAAEKVSDVTKKTAGNNNDNPVVTSKETASISKNSKKTSFLPENEIEKNSNSVIDDFAEEGITIPEEEVVETSKNSDVTDCNTLLKEANFLYNEKEFEAAYEKVNKYLEFATTDIDKGLLLKGQILEARSDFQDIKGAIEVYKTLMKEYPASIHWDEANKRVIYLKRFYLEVR